MDHFSRLTSLESSELIPKFFNELWAKEYSSTSRLVNQKQIIYSCLTLPCLHEVAASYMALLGSSLYYLIETHCQRKIKFENLAKSTDSQYWIHGYARNLLRLDTWYPSWVKDASKFPNRRRSKNSLIHKFSVQQAWMLPLMLGISRSVQNWSLKNRGTSTVRRRFVVCVHY